MKPVVDSGGAIRLVMYCNGGAAVAAVEIAPTRAIKIAGELLDSAGSRLGAELAELRARDSR